MVGLLRSGADGPAFDVDVALVEAIAHDHGPSLALGAALAGTGGDRRAALERAVELRSAAGAGDEALTAALVELERTDDALASLVDEYRSKLDVHVHSPMLLGAWGVHLVGVFEALGRPAFRGFVMAACDADYDRISVLVRALRAASLDGERERLRNGLLYDADEASEDWLIDAEDGS